MKKGLTQIVLGRERKLAEWMPQAKAAGYEGLEILLTDEGDLPLGSTESDYQRLRDLSAQSGVELAGLCIGVSDRGSLTTGRPADAERFQEVTVQALEASVALGIDTILVIPGGVTEEVPYERAYERALAGMKELAPEAERRGVNLAIEYVWNKLFLSPLEMRRFLDEVGSEYVGFYMDTGNMVIFGYPEQWIRLCGPYLKKVHFKDFRRRGYQWTPLLEGDVNWPAVMAALREIGYDDYLISEVSGDWAAHTRTAQAMEKILQM
ncbi:MAG TPA: sugar phosphate isomerase/epimerase [Armatimonadetes bacterium]|nr:sugar phosphate isomerase/epimerase [Armatimonadota bacterium]